MANVSLHDACKDDYELAIRALKAVKKGTVGLNQELAFACYNNNKKIAEFMIQNGADVNWGLSASCASNNEELAKLMIEKGATNFEWGLSNACRMGNKKLVLFMIDKGADINNCFIHLNTIEIEYLLLKNRKRYKNIHDFNIGYSYRNITNREVLLNIVFHNSLVNDILKY